MKAKVILPIFFLMIFSLSFVLASECFDAGYQCFDMSCSAGYEEVSNLNCPSLVGNRPEVCCKEVIDLSVEPEIILNQESYQRGDTFSVEFKLPYLSDCSYYFVSPTGEEKQEGGGGCGVSVSSTTSDIVARLEQLFGSGEPGTYKIKIIAEKDGYDDIVKTKEFRIVKETPREEVECIIKDGSGSCNLLGTSYQIKHKGCSDQIELDITYNGITEKFDNLESLSELILKDRTNIKLNGVPCAVYQANLIFKKNIDVSEEGTYTIKKNDLIKMNEVWAKVREISWALSGDTDPKVEINGVNAQVCSLKEGEECKIFYGAVSNPESKKLKIKVNSIEINEAKPEESTASVTFTKIYEVIVIEPNEEEPSDIVEGESPKIIEIPEKEIPEEKRNKEIIYLCSGCELNDKCYPFGFRKNGNYCSDENDEFVSQKNPELSCENNFECDSNLCINDECVSGSLWAKFMRWLSSIFG
ncbi:MAG: hypothetical protein KKF48_05150 [Nanoarchaeota archaeon]|nr:hypothetical protein [Nanoarchaeota archaeon]MBU1028405.1 hypothetical protein [Nanoarchaeota archaeon]